MGRKISRTLVVALLVAVTSVALGGRADAAGGPDFVGGQQVAPYAGNYGPNLSYSGTKTLVVWGKTVGGQLDIYGRIMAPDATSIGPAFPIAEKAETELRPVAAWNGSSWLVVWQSRTDPTGQIFGRRVSAAGALLGSELAIAATADATVRPAVAAGQNGQFLVVWRDDRNSAEGAAGDTASDIYGRRVTSSGGLLDGAGLRLSGDTPSARTSDDEPDVAWNGSTYLVAWSATVVGGRRVDATQRRADGTKLRGGTLTPAALSAAFPSVASDGTDFLVVFSSSAATGDVGGVRVKASDFTKKVFTISNATGDQGDPVVGFNGVYLVAWIDRRNGSFDIWGARVAPDTTVADPSGFLITEYYPGNDGPSIAPGGTKASTFGFAWSPTPAGQQSGVVAYGIQFAPK